MDPITAIQLASSVIAFVDLATKLVTGTYEVYNSTTGSTVENAHIDNIIGDLEEVAAGLETRVPGKSKHDRTLKELASKCGKVADDLLRLLNKIKSDGSDSTWKSLRVAFNSMRKQKEIAGLEKRLNDYRSQILIRLTLMLQDQNCSMKLQLDKLENASLTLSSESALRAKALREHISQDVKDIQNSDASLNSPTSNSKDGLLHLEQGLKDLAKLITIVPKENVILENLYYDSLDSRERTIVEAETGTFEWIFEEAPDHDNSRVTATGGDKPGSAAPAETDSEKNSEPNSSTKSADGGAQQDAEEAAQNSSPSLSATPTPLENEQRPVPPDLDWHETYSRYFDKEQFERRADTRARFVAWLNSGQGILHVSAKAGAGKSTFMKFICNHERTKAELEAWAGQKKLVFSSFYFWKSQDEMQMSLEGLYRSILFTTLRQCPELIPAVFPIQWEKLKSGRFIVGKIISHSDLVNAFETLTSTGTFPNHRFCYFVDGLDEYNGHSLDYVRLVKSLQRWTSNCDVKVCASSRPYIEYEQLSTSPDQKIRLHHLTRHDIYLFCRQMIEKDDNFEQIKDSYLSLVAEVVGRSEGVFLWARLVVNSLLVGMMRHDNLATLRRKLEVTPEDLDQLYDQLLNSLDEDDRERGEKLLLLTADAYKEYTIVTYWMFENFDSLAFSPYTTGRPTSWPSTQKMENDARLQIKSLTKGILETRAARYGEIEIQRVDFFHRTARDYVLTRLKPPKKTDPSDKILDLFIEKDTYFRMRLAELASYDIRTRKAVWNHCFIAFWEIIKHLSLELMDAYRCLLEEDNNSIPSDPESDDIFTGLMRGPERGYYLMHRLSFVHMAAYMGKTDYVLQEIDADPSLLRSGQELNLLFSATVGDQVDLMEALIERGCSLAHSIRTRLKDGDKDIPDGTIPIWLAVVLSQFRTFVNCDRYNILGKFVKCYLTLEKLLGYVHEDARNCFFLLRDERRDDVTHFITLKQFIEEAEPENKEGLLSILEESRGRSLIKGAREFLSHFVPVVGKSKPSLASQTDAYIPYSLKDKKPMVVQAIVCNGNRADTCWIRWF